MAGRKSSTRLSPAFKRGAVCIAFLILGYQVAVFLQHSAVLKIEADRDRPDTVYISGAARQKQSIADCLPTDSAAGETSGSVSRREAPHSPVVQSVREQTRRVESFKFNPNTATVEEFQRLGFSPKQAESIENYRQRGGRFRRKSDFAKSFVVADSVYRRLEKFIDIPLLDINKADSAAFDALPGIGGYFASKMVKYREALGGYSYPEQLMDIYHFDRDKYDALADLIVCSESEAFELWTLPAEELRKHPYIRNYQTARAIILFRENSPADSLSVGALRRAGILNEENAEKLQRCRIGAAR